MRLTEFIQQHHEKLIEEWAKFARTLFPSARDMSDEVIRDHADELLTAIVSDMETFQSCQQQSEKSQGRASQGKLGSVGLKHASERLRSGFKLTHLVAEYRALRASVLRLWEEDSNGDQDSPTTRFNEAIDEALAEATIGYTEEINRTREQFLAILGHDLRDPLNGIIVGATVLTKSEIVDDKLARVATRILHSAGRMSRLVDDLLDLTRTRFGPGIPVTPKLMDLAAICQQVISEFEVIHPDCHLRFESKGDLHGEWDRDRLTQVISNLVANALAYGGEDGSVNLVAQEQGGDIVLQVHNEGPLIPEDVMRTIFEPMVRHPTRDDKNPTGLGLGLYIAREVVKAHGGNIGVTSTKKAGTTFTVQLPRHPPRPPMATGDNNS